MERQIAAFGSQCAARPHAQGRDAQLRLPQIRLDGGSGNRQGALGGARQLHASGRLLAAQPDAQAFQVEVLETDLRGAGIIAGKGPLTIALNGGTGQLGFKVRGQLRAFGGGGKSGVAQRLVVDAQSAAVERSVQADQAEARLTRLGGRDIHYAAAMKFSRAIDAGILFAHHLKLTEWHGIAVELEAELADSEIRGLMLIARMN